jgi:predicted phage-related endonuclease
MRLPRRRRRGLGGRHSPSGTASGVEKVADWRVVLSHKFDSELFKHEHPDLYGSYSRETRFRRFNLL